MFRCVVVATDGSPTADVAVQHAVDLARRCKARLHLVDARRSGGAVMATSLETAAMVGAGVDAARVGGQERVLQLPDRDLRLDPVVPVDRL